MTSTKQPLLKTFWLYGSIVFSTILMVGGVLIAFSVKGHQGIMIGVLVVAVGFVLLSSFVQLIKGVGA